MSYPIQCTAGFPMPLVAGKFEIVGFSATIETPANTAQLAIFDDTRITKDDSFGKLVPLGDIYNIKTLIHDEKSLAATQGCLWYEFSEPIKVRYGISISADNVKGGSITIYRR